MDQKEVFSLSPDSEIIPNGPWTLPTLYKSGKRSDKTLMMWKVEYDGIETLTTTFGQVGSDKLRKTFVSIKTNKSGRSLKEQAFLQARQRYNDKYRDDGYRQEGEEPSEDKEPMCANIYSPKTEKKDKGHKYIEKFPVAVQVKLDGIRQLARIKEGKIRFRSRQNLETKFFDGIRKELMTFLSYLPENSELDGEFCAPLDKAGFLEIQSIVRTTDHVHPQEELIVYYIFDIITVEPMIYEDRYNLLIDTYRRFLEDGHKNEKFVLLSYELANNDEEIQKFMHRYVKAGYEGLMIRRLGGVEGEKLSVYHHGRCDNLLKYKPFFDAEGKCIRVTEAKGTEAGTAILVLEITTPLGEKKEISVRMRGSFEQRAAWFRSPETIIGKDITYRYQELSEYGIPRFPVGVAVRDYE